MKRRLRAIDFSDCECHCACCGVDIPIQSTQDLNESWVSTMAFVAMGVITEDDADCNVSFCPRCAEHIIGPEWRALGKWKADQYTAWIIVDAMLSREPVPGRLH